MFRAACSSPPTTAPTATRHSARSSTARSCLNEDGNYVANEAYKDVPGAVFVEGNIPATGDTGVHAIDDVVLQASGPGADRFKGYMEQSDVYRVIAEALALGAKQTQ